MKLSTTSATLLAQLRRSPASPPRAVPCRRSRASSWRRSDGRRRAARHRHGGRPARAAGGRDRARGRGRPAGAPAARRRPRAARGAGHPRAAPERAATSRSCRARRPSTSARCAPRTSRRSRSRAATRSSASRRVAFVETVREGRPLGVARRDAADPHRHPRLRLGVGPADGRDGLLPPVGEGDAAGARRWRARSRPTCRPARCRSSCGIVPQARRRGRARPSACAPTRSSSRLGGVVLSSRLIDGQFPNYRQLLPDTLRARAAREPAAS